MWGWLIDHVPGLRHEVAWRVLRAELATADRYMSAANGGLLSAFPPITAPQMPPSAGLAGGQTDSGAEAERRAKHAARVAEAMEKDAAAKYARRPG